MTHPLIDECSIPMAAHAAAVLRRRARNAHLHEGPRPVPPVCLPCSYLGRYTAVACPSDPAGAPSGLRWVCHSSRGESWSLRQPRPGWAGRAIGHVYRLPLWRDRKRRWVHWPALHPRRYDSPAAAAEVLAREVRRG